jgi:hypothetical protein
VRRRASARSHDQPWRAACSARDEDDAARGFGAAAPRTRAPSALPCAVRSHPTRHRRAHRSTPESSPGPAAGRGRGVPWLRRRRRAGCHQRPRADPEPERPTAAHWVHTEAVPRPPRVPGLGPASPSSAPLTQDRTCSRSGWPTRPGRPRSTRSSRPAPPHTAERPRQLRCLAGHRCRQRRHPR